MLAQDDQDEKEKVLYYLSRRLAKTELKYNPIEKTTAIKGQGLANFLIDHPILADWEISEDFPNEEVFFVKAFQPWMMFFDGAAWSDGVGARALIIGLQMALELGIPSLAANGDSKLIINKLPKEYEVKMEDLVPYFDYATNLINKFNSVELEHG
ncbi:hypothetical protein RJ639_012779 [Escallonia herrerae]|uniref:RNase H type-1 domain-containing protein n=1 Tax=Escallonia herrerae TaxID=1293975 RepID=A0AA89APS0_9ASTE|nr:hypothetical protein RJ639_012779 [Escallonia herrerae]